MLQIVEMNLSKLKDRIIKCFQGQFIIPANLEPKMDRKKYDDLNIEEITFIRTSAKFLVEVSISKHFLIS